ncbi:transcription factor TFIIIB component B'' homolog isoform X2 [Anthonomus grandis grandis]|uniref:transcription factor TFIIIB component B'' homolog isoform X2 n=1 Tax=Anthonomus grandis grandis TaxID=2921223 RepID=UPI0021668687|nr:transcription factor TFIIIB component B'' homolog isoform X2 [Anthonomus grandis grandis]
MLARRTRIKGIANIPQRKKPDPPSKTVTEEEGASVSPDPGPTEPKPEEIPTPAEPQPQEESKPAPARRKFLKPGINLNSIKQRTPNQQVDTPPEPSGPGKVVLLSELRLPAVGNVSEPPQGETEDTLGDNPVVGPKRVVIENAASDSEYPGPPPSPSKINRARIKAVPKLGLRKTSCSASESEDESRKYGRIRNNSVCSVVSQEAPSTPKLPETWAKKEEGPPIQKKLHRSDQSRKLAEARREFYKKFGTTVPDKHKLRMIDLIFYNPSNSPLSKKEDPKESEKETIVDEPPGELLEVEESTAGEREDAAEEEDNNMPVPQIKIGPSGEIILDEQSLVVENKKLAKQKEQMAKSNVVDGDFDTGYGVFKKVKRSTPWSEKETLKFYKALNCIGTDFTAMTQLFPKRTRRDLKMKFKKEEKLNRLLVNKAVRQHCCYNFADLKREAQVEAEEEAFLLQLREEETRKKKEERAEKLKKHREKLGNKKSEERGSEEGAAEAVFSNNHVDETIEEVLRSIRKRTGEEEKEENEADLPMKKRISGVKRRKSTVKVVASSSDEDADVSDCEEEEEEEEEEFIPFLKPTRSGRMPKSTIKFQEVVEVEEAQQPPKRVRRPSETRRGRGAPRKTPAEPPGDVTAAKNRRFSSTSSMDSNADKLVPGSVVVTTEESSGGKPEYKVFMVTPERRLTGLELESDVIAMLVADKQGETTTTTDAALKEDENNLTIPAKLDNTVDENSEGSGSIAMVD